MSTEKRFESDGVGNSALEIRRSVRPRTAGVAKVPLLVGVRREAPHRRRPGARVDGAVRVAAKVVIAQAGVLRSVGREWWRVSRVV